MFSRLLSVARAMCAHFCLAPLLLLAAPAAAQQTPTQPAQQTPAQPAQQTTPQPSASGPAASSAKAFVPFLPALPPGVVPPHVEAHYPCHFPRARFVPSPVQPVVLNFTVTTKGLVTNISLAQSSGSALLDDTARGCIANDLYAPALRGGAPVETPWASQIDFRIVKLRPFERMSQPPPGSTRMPVERFNLVAGECQKWHGRAPHGVFVAFDVEPDGSVKNASVAQSSGDAGEDKDALDCVAHRIYRPATHDGQPVEFRLTAELYDRYPY